jgi:hypothetical protein
MDTVPRHFDEEMPETLWVANNYRGVRAEIDPTMSADWRMSASRAPVAS